MIKSGCPRPDIYLKSPALARDDTPNVLIIIDTSGSMNERRPYPVRSDGYCAGDLNTLVAASN